MLEKRLADFCKNLSYQNLPSEVVHATKRCCLDWFSAAIPGGIEKPVKLIIETLAGELNFG